MQNCQPIYTYLNIELSFKPSNSVFCDAIYFLSFNTCNHSMAEISTLFKCYAMSWQLKYLQDSSMGKPTEILSSWLLNCKTLYKFLL